MPGWDKTEGYAYTSFTFSSVATVLIVFLILRNLLLLLGFQQPLELRCGDFGRSLIISIKSRCRRTVAQNASVRNRTVSVHNKVATYSTQLSCLFFLLYCIGAAAVYISVDGFNWLPFSWCKYGMPTNMATFSLAKAFLYFTLTARLQLGFKDSAYAYGKRTIYGLYSFIVVSILVAIVSISIVVRGERNGWYKKSIGKNKEVEIRKCYTSVPMLLWVYAAFVDISLTISIVYLFNSALKRVLTNLLKTMDEMSQSQHKKENADLFLLPLKYTTISTVAVCSTLVSIFFMGVTSAAFVVAIDSVVNCCALLLMTKKWKPVYVLLCSPLLRCVARTPCLGCADLAELEIIDAVVDKQKTLKSQLSVVSISGDASL